MVRHGSRVLCIECKTRGLSPKSRFTGEANLIRKDITRAEGDSKGSSLAGGVAQLLRTRQAILEGRAGLEEFHDASGIDCVLVTLDDVHHGNVDQYFRSILTEEALKVPECGEYAPYQVTDVSGFESLCRLSLLDGESPLDLIHTKLSSDAERQKDFQLYFPYMTGGRPLPRHPLQEGLSDRVMDEILSVFRA